MLVLGMTLLAWRALDPFGGPESDFIAESEPYPYSSRVDDACEETTIDPGDGRVLTVGSRNPLATGGPFGTSPTRCTTVDVYAGSKLVSVFRLSEAGAGVSHVLTFDATRGRSPLLVIVTVEGSQSASSTDEKTRAIGVDPEDGSVVWEGRPRVRQDTSMVRIGQSLLVAEHNQKLRSTSASVFDPATGHARFTARCPRGMDEDSVDAYDIEDAVGSSTGVITGYEFRCSRPGENSVSYVVDERGMSRR